MDIKQMIYFKTIVEAGTISKAAELLHMAQPPLSTQLKQLEEELGVILLKRGHRKIELTQAGRLFYKRSLQIISLTEITEQEVKDTQNELLRIGITSSNSALFKHLYNDTLSFTYRIYEGSTYELIDLLNAHTIDIGIVRTPFDQSDVNAYYLPKEPMIAIGFPQYLHAHMNQITDYKNLPLIIHKRYLTFISDFCLKNHFNPFIKITSDDCRSSIIYAQNGYGIAIIPQSALQMVTDSHLVKATLFNLELYTSVALITRKNEPLDHKTNQLIETFLKNIEKDNT